MSRIVVFASACFLLLIPLSGHDLYLLPDHFLLQPRATIQVAFHNGDAFPESEVAPKPERLKDALLHSATQTVPISGLRIAGNETVGATQALTAGCLLLSVRTVPNFIELPAGKFTAYLKEEGLTGVLRWRDQHQQVARPGRERYRKFAKSLLTAGTPDHFCRQPLGLPIEIIPLVDPYALRAGSRLPVQILFQGKPARDQQLEAAWAGDADKKVQVVGRTNAAGQIEVPITRPGKWRLHTLIMERCAEPKIADWESYWASLTFAI